MSSKYKTCICGFIFMVMFSCDDFVLIDPPRTDLTRQTVFTGNETADAAVADIYFQIGNDGFAGGSINSITLMTALSADELVNAISWDNNYQQVNDNAIIPANSLITFLWEDIYSCIYKCNAVLEGLDASDKVSQPAKQQLIGEAKFLRAFSHFYLVNLFGDVPLVLSTDYEINQNILRNSSANVYDQIVADLLDAQNSLPDDFSFSSGEKIRVNRVVATAFLARVYLYMQEWSNAEEQASKVIGDLRYSLKTNLNEVFLKNSSEAIFQFHPRFGYPGDLSTFIEYGFRLDQDLIDSFEAGDLRNSQWNLNGTSYKYNSPTRNSEYSTV
ncbi:MAG TPA: RagB/SusD family nutrient uptake outer membrane protein, partial [Flavitalea sp.]|nr:RagB/SusD family nutrient uptake outer membrane protein [Flavitalea sp.]